jgi:hypothetical protein
MASEIEAGIRKDADLEEDGSEGENETSD